MIRHSRELRSERVAALLLAATLPLAACGVEGRDASGRAADPVLEETGAVAELVPGSRRRPSPVPLVTTWLIPPDPDQDPPLAAPAGLAIDEVRGRLYLLDLRPPELRVHASADGTFLHRLAQEGGGPGELRAPMSLAVGADGVVAVVAVDGRVSLWSPDGSFTGVARVGSGLATNIVPIGTEGFLVKIDRFPPADVSEFQTVATDGTAGGVRFADDRMPESAAAPAGARNHAYALAGGRDGELLIAVPGPEYRILSVSPAGAVAAFARRPELTQPARTPEEITALRARVRRGFQAAGRRSPDRVAIPENRPHIVALAVGPDGDVWALTGRGAAGSSIIDRFDRHGAFLASYLVELRVAELKVGWRSIYLLAADAEDVPGVAIAPIPASGQPKRGETGEGAR